MANMQSTSDYGIFPLGDYDFEETTVTLSEYPDVVDLGISVDADRLYQDYLNMRKPSKDHYYLSMSKKFKLDAKKVMENFEELGFKQDNYGGYGFQRAGEYTKSLLDELPVKTFRKHFTLAVPNWETKFHSDHNRFETHGFRLVIPMNTDAYIRYKNGDYRLKTGSMYFWNIVKEHSGWNPTNQERVIIMAQMNSDRLINEGTMVKQLL
jgi:hypothetical protein